MRRYRSLTAAAAALMLAAAPFLVDVVSAPAAGAANITAPGAIHLGDSVSGSITDPAVADQYTFSVTAPGVRSYLRPIDNACQCVWSLTGPTGTVFSQNMSSGDVGPTFLATGSYVLRVNGTAAHTGIYSFNSWVVPDPQTFGISVGATVSNGVPSAGAGNIESPGAVDRYTFTVGGGGESVYLENLANSCGCSWSLRGSTGSLADGFASQAISDVGPIFLAAGPYVLTVNDPSAHTGVYSFRITSVTPPQTFPISVGDTISSGVPSAGAGNIEVPGAVDNYTFTVGGGGESVYLQNLVDNCGCLWSLRSAAGSLDAGFVTQGISDVGPKWLAAGSYVLTVNSQSGHTGTYSFKMSAIDSPQTFAITLGDTIAQNIPSSGAGDIETPGAVDQYTFTVGGGGVSVYLQDLVDNCGCSWTLRAANGSFEHGFVDQSISDVGPTWLAVGSYVLTVDGHSGRTGTYSFQSFTVATAQTFPITLGSVVSNGSPSAGAGNIEGPGSVDRYTFSASAGDRISIADAGCTTAPTFVLSAPSGRQLVRGQLCNSADVLDLPNETGQYSLAVSADASNLGLYSFQVATTTDDTTITLAPAEVFPISLGATVSHAVPASGEADDYAFNGTAGQSIRVDDLSGSGCCDAFWQLYAPDGTALGGYWLYAGYGQQFMLPQTGTYEIEVTGNASGTYSFSLTSGPPAQVFPISIGDTVTNGQPTTGAGNIEFPGSDDEYAFSGTAGQIVRFNDPGDLGCCALFWQIYAPDGTQLGGNWLGNSPGQEFTLPATGQYTIRVNDLYNYYYYGYYGGATGTYSFSLTSAPAPQVFAIALGDTVAQNIPSSGAGDIDVSGAVDEYAFTGTAGQTIRFNDLTDSGCCDLYWELFGPDGFQLGANYLGNSSGQQFTLPATGQYTIHVDDSSSAFGTATGTYSFSLSVSPAAQVFAIALGDTITDGAPSAGAGNIEAPGSDDEYSFTGTAGQTIRFNDLNTLTCCTLYWRVYAPDGTSIGENWLGNSQGQQFTLSSTGQYTIRVNDYYFATDATATGTYSFSLTPVPLLVPPITAPITTFLSPGQDAVWSVVIQNTSAASLQDVTATLHANADGTPLAFHGAAMPGCSPGLGDSEVCTLADLPPHSTTMLSVFAQTTGASPGSVVTGDIDVSATGVADATGLLGAVTMASCGTACVLAVAAPGVVVSSTPGDPTPALPTKQVLALPANQPGGEAQPPIPVKLQSITPSAFESAPDKKLCPVGPNVTHCSGQISTITAQFAKYVDPAHPIRVKVVARWGSTTPTGRILMEKDAGGDPLFLIACAQDPTTHRYNTPCVLPETHTGSTAAGNLITTNEILFTGPDIHFTRRTSTGATIIKPPSAPTTVTATPGALKATVKWKAPTATNGAAVSSYVVTVLSAGTVVKTVTYASSALTQTVTGLTNGKAYTFKVAAKNVAGASVQSVASAATVVGAPSPPTAITATKAAAGSIRVAFTAPANNGAAITGYTATCTSTNLGVTKTKTGTASPLIVTGLTVGKTYKCTVKATNSRGTGPPSVASAAVIA